MILVNGAQQSFVPAHDRGLAYGDGVFRTLAVRNGAVLHWSWHYRKLAGDCAKLRIPAPIETVVSGELAALAAREPECAVRITVTRGPSQRGYSPPAIPDPTRIVASFPLPDYPEDYALRGIRAHLCELRLGPQPTFAGVKHLNRLENVLARMEWDADRFAEGVLRDRDGHVVGGTMSNVFIVEGSGLATPDLMQCGVAGVTRERIFACCRARGLECAVEPITLERLLDADEVFFVNTLIGVWPIRSLGGKTWGGSAVAARVRKWLDEAEAPG